MGTARLTIRAGADWVQGFTYKVDGTPTQVDDPRAQVRALPHLPPVLDLSGDQISQDSPGALVFRAGHEATSALHPALGYQWDLFGTVAGKRDKLVDTSPIDVLPAVTHE